MNHLQHEGQNIPLPAGCTIHKVFNRFEDYRLIASSPDMVPIVWNGRFWQLCSPLIANLFAAACVKAK